MYVQLRLRHATLRLCVSVLDVCADSDSCAHRGSDVLAFECALDARSFGFTVGGAVVRAVGRADLADLGELRAVGRRELRAVVRRELCAVGRRELCAVHQLQPLAAAFGYLNVPGPRRA